MSKTQYQTANAALTHLLNGERFSRLNLPQDVGTINSSLHSIISTIQNKYFVPICSEYNIHNVCEYWVEKEEIERFYNDRESQREEMKHEVRLRSIQREAKALLRLAEKLATNSDGLNLVIQELDGKGKFAELVIQAANDSFGKNGGDAA
ncbi:hypothetical protein [Thiomicrorhabdus sp. Kp2]|uniref:hypothetical protein n=1 Tax=Thiomicrorhabdus sp. Kp2 TaxID=1123518 RepID=UPI0004010B79|nr:hypothetical protein [Thiomicrorhabdus sp. Kp2]